MEEVECFFWRERQWEEEGVYSVFYSIRYNVKAIPSYICTSPNKNVLTPTVHVLLLEVIGF